MSERRVSSQTCEKSPPATLLLIGGDAHGTLEKKFRAAGYKVFAIRDHQAAIDHARHERFAVAVVVSAGCLINDAEAVFNLRDISPSTEIVIVLDKKRRLSNRIVQQLREHPIEHTQFLTRRELQRQWLRACGASPAGLPTG